MTKSFKLLMLSIYALLASCSSGLQDEKIRGDFILQQKKLGFPPPGKMTKIVRGDGWSDGLEVRVYFCLNQEIQSGRCKETRVSMSYQKFADGWRLISFASERGAE